jgi:chaperonin GroES
MAKRTYLAPANVSLETLERWNEEDRSRKVLEENNMKLRPLQDRVIVKQSEAETKTASGIVLPDSAKEKPTKGKVIAVGPGKLDENGKPMELGVRIGDTVYYGKYSGTDIEVQGEKFVILRETDILGVLE